MNNEREAKMQEPNPPFAVEIIDTNPVEITNPYSGVKCVLEPTAVAVYDCIKGAEMIAGDDPDSEHWGTVRKGLDWFIEHYPDAYMKLLD